MSVLFPAPFGPAIPITSPARTSSEKSSTARTGRPSRERYVFPTASNSITGAGRRADSPRRGAGGRQPGGAGSSRRYSPGGRARGQARRPAPRPGARQEALGLRRPAEPRQCAPQVADRGRVVRVELDGRSEEHTSELQSRGQLVCRLLLEKKNRTKTRPPRDKKRTN